MRARSTAKTAVAKAPEGLTFHREAVTANSASKYAKSEFATSLLRLQRSHGNRYVQYAIQTKLGITQPGDPYELEADRVANYITSLPGENSAQTVQKASNVDEKDEMKGVRESSTQTERTSRNSTPLPISVEEDKEKISGLTKISRVADVATRTSPAVEGVVEAASHSAAHSLPPNLQRKFERALGADLGAVQLHTGTESIAASRALGARAYTISSHIHFNESQYAPESSAGQALLAHEVAHVLQQRTAEIQSPAMLSNTGDYCERRSEEPTSSVMTDKKTDKPSPGSGSSAGAPAISNVGVGLQRKVGDGHDLASPRFARQVTLEACYDNEHVMVVGDSDSTAVASVQAALIDLGYAMPISTRKVGAPDGIFGPETKQTVTRFQSDQGLKLLDGKVGPETMTRLDQLFSAGPVPVPGKKKPEIEATEEAVGKRVAEKMEAANIGPHTADEGIHYARNYRQSFPERWKDDYMNGFADPRYFVRLGFMDWVLKPGVSASEAIKSWLKGLTIAECFTTIVAIEYDTLRAAIGDEKFDQTFGGPSLTLPAGKQLRIAPPGGARIPLDDYMKPTGAAAAGNEGSFNNRPAKLGEWYYFYNHPKYLLKHPFGEWQGENSIYMGRNAAGDQLWQGLGTATPEGRVGSVTEEQMLEEMVDAYNGGRDPDDDKDLERIKNANGGVLPKEYVFEKDGGELPETITKDRILNDPPYKIDGINRKGGFRGAAGQTIDVGKATLLRDAP